MFTTSSPPSTSSSATSINQPLVDDTPIIRRIKRRAGLDSASVSSRSPKTPTDKGKAQDKEITFKQSLQELVKDLDPLMTVCTSFAIIESMTKVQCLQRFSEGIIAGTRSITKACIRVFSIDIQSLYTISDMYPDDWWRAWLISLFLR